MNRTTPYSSHNVPIWMTSNNNTRWRFCWVLPQFLCLIPARDELSYGMYVRSDPFLSERLCVRPRYWWGVQQLGPCLQRQVRTHATSDMAGFWTLQGTHVTEMIVKKSRFVSYAWPAESSSQALNLIASTRDPSASHNCWAFSVQQQVRSSDDGEPSGTAGRPILSAIQGLALDNTCVMTTRYFGGVKLGANGLVHAYRDSALRCLEEAPKFFVKHQVRLLLELGFDHLGTIYHALERHGACRETEEYTSTGMVKIVAATDVDVVNDLQQAVLQATKGAVKAVVFSESQ